MAIQKPPTILINAVNFGPSSTGAFNGGVLDLTPWTDFSWADEITFTVHISAINGSPMSGSLTGKFQFAAPFTGGGQQFGSTRLFDLDTNQKASFIEEGEDWGTIASFNTSTPVTVRRTIRGFGSRCNLHLDTSTLSGGTTPTFTVTVTMSAKSGTGGSSGLKGSATGAAVPPVAAYLGLINNSGNLVGTGSTTRAINNGTSDTIQAAGMIGQYNSSAPTVTSGNWYVAQLDVNGNLKTTSVGGLMPTGSALNTYSLHSTSNATTTPTPSTAYISMISISAEVAGTTSTITIQDKQGTPLKLVNGLSTTTLTTTPTTVNFQTPAKMVSGIDIITAGAVAATIDVWINYYQ